VNQTVILLYFKCRSGMIWSLVNFCKPKEFGTHDLKSALWQVAKLAGTSPALSDAAIGPCGSRVGEVLSPWSTTNYIPSGKLT